MDNITQPLISIICLCYNHEDYVIEALDSVLMQDYSNIQLIVIDDYSQDNSVNRIKTYLESKPKVIFIPNKRNIGNCRSFNKAFTFAQGKYVIDLAADDVLVKGMLKKQVAFFEQQKDNVGVLFANAQYITEQGESIKLHHKINEKSKSISPPPQGEIYLDLVKSYFICPPTMMMKTDVLEALGGYDPMLAYEDFDFWIRSSRDYHYAYIDEAVVKKRVVKGSLSSKAHQRKMQKSTFEVCKKIYKLNKTKREHQALLWRLLYEAKPALKTVYLSLVVRYMILFLKTTLKAFF